MIRGGTGIFGGTFNPIHVGHLRAAEDAREQLQLERVIFVPSASPPHKEDGGGEHSIAPAAARARWVDAAIAGHAQFEISRVELERRGPSYTVDTLEGFCRTDPATRPVFLIGHDAFCELDTWHEPERLFELAHFAVLVRPPASRRPLLEWIPKTLATNLRFSADGCVAVHPSGGETQAVEIAGLEVSSTELRRRLHDGRSIRYLVPESVRAEMEQTFRATSAPEPPFE
jgi:nicotinate-nucleotide adenylyltransferase